MKCIICNNIIEGYGNNPTPIKEVSEGKACNKCYAEIILPARFELPQFKTNLKKVKKWQENNTKVWWIYLNKF